MYSDAPGLLVYHLVQIVVLVIYQCQYDFVNQVDRISGFIAPFFSEPF